MKNPPRINVTAGILHQKEKILIAQRPEEKYHGLWEFPGGKIEEGESPEACLQRELKEELGINCVVGKKISTTEWARKDKLIVLHTYDILSFTGTPEVIVHKAIKWVNLKDLRVDEFLPADKPVIERLLSS